MAGRAGDCNDFGRMNDCYAAVVLVHGIGDMEPGSALTPAVTRISQTYPSIGISDAAEGAGNLQRRQLKTPGTRLDLIEFHWSGVAGKIRGHNPFKSFVYLLDLFRDLPRICLWQSTSRRLAVMSNATAAFFLSAAVIHAAFLVVFFVEQSLEQQPPTGGQTSSLDVLHPATRFVGYAWALQQLLCFLLVVAAAIAAVILLVLRRRSDWFVFCTGTVAVGMIYAGYFVLLSIMAAAVSGIAATLAEGAGADPMSLLLFGAVAVASLVLLVLAPQMAIADLLRDVAHYFVPSSDRQDHAHTRDTKRRLHDLLVELASSGTQRIVIVAHSLGTVITTEVLRQLRVSETSPALRIDLVTCGSPLELLPTFLPRRVPPVDSIFEELRGRRGWAFGGWMNAYRVLDYVGRALGGRRIPQSRPDEIVNALEAELVDVRLSPWYRPPYSHANYWQDSRLLHLLMTTILKPILSADAKP